MSEYYIPINRESLAKRIQEKDYMKKITLGQFTNWSKEHFISGDLIKIFIVGKLFHHRVIADFANALEAVYFIIKNRKHLVHKFYASKQMSVLYNEVEKAAEIDILEDVYLTREQLYNFLYLFGEFETNWLFDIHKLKKENINTLLKLKKYFAEQNPAVLNIIEEPKRMCVYDESSPLSSGSSIYSRFRRRYFPGELSDDSPSEA
jgi:hypothetical protein